MKNIANYALIVLLVAIAVYAVQGVSLFGPSSASLVGQQAPTFELENYSEETIDLDDLRGRVVLLSFWFPSCPYCRIELPHFELLSKKYRDSDLAVIAIETTGNNTAAKQFIRDSGLTFEFVEDKIINGTSAAINYKVQQYPTAFLIDRDGTVRSHYVGFAPGQEKNIESDIARLLKDETAASK